MFSLAYVRNVLTPSGPAPSAADWGAMIGFFLFVGCGLGLIALVVRGLDLSRITHHVGEGGGRVTAIRRKRFAPGWPVLRSRSYEVTYENEDGTRSTRVCRTQALGGVLWNESDHGRRRH